MRVSLYFFYVSRFGFLFEVVMSTDLYMLCLLEIAACLSIRLVDASLCLMEKYSLNGKIYSYRLKILMLPWKTVIFVFNLLNMLLTPYTVVLTRDTEFVYAAFRQTFCLTK